MLPKVRVPRPRSLRSWRELADEIKAAEAHSWSLSARFDSLPPHAEARPRVDSSEWGESPMLERSL